MAIEGPGRAGVPSLTSLPRYEDIPQIGDGLDADRVKDAFDAFRRHAAQLQAQLRVLQAAGARTGPSVEPTGHAVRMDALHLIRAAAEFADTIERDAQNASAAQLGKTEEEVSRRQRELQEREAELERYRQESERQRAEMLNATRNETRELLAKAHADATRELQEAEAKGSRLLEQSRHQATELTNAARAEVEQTLEWARAQGSAVLARAQHGAEQLLSAAGLGQDAIAQVAGAIVRAAESAGEAARPQPPAAAFAGPAAVETPPVTEAPPVSEPPTPPPASSPPPPPTSSTDEEPAGGDTESSGP
jgi:DNA repair exonuclease SbcCD ATPase subunit